MGFFRRRFTARRAAAKAQVIGICRFSYNALGGFKREHESPEARAAYLYAPARLDERFRLFEAITLPSVRAQTDKDFTFLIVISEDFPPERRAQLEALTADIPQVVIQAHPPGNHRAVMKQAINSVRRRGCYSVQFRLDDDDAINRRFVAETRKTLRQHYPLFRASRHVVLDYTRGFNVRAGAEGLAAEPANQLHLGVAYAIIFRSDVSLSVMNFTHHTAWQHMPTISKTDKNMWLRGVNDHNDSGDRIGLETVSLTSAQEAEFARDFGINAEQLRAIWRR
ncbi:glycosyltransferase [Pararhodobacter oceanensis]|uniref:glycosyltransferase n=1 Tax=Pararhodobacter oceanensis TaxID=2172121 RepID=UPI003A947E17